ncbi:MAG: hypothetical protein JXB15_12900 [Anaerolineales bacterium]|nr:hypothetical protein [Anaerolineales bacterium]
MNKIRLLCMLSLFSLIAATLAGCNLPSAKSDITPTMNVTQAYQTVEARLTQAAGLTPQITQPASPTSAPLSTPTTSGESTATLAPTTPPANTAAPTSSCDLAAPGNPIDVTIPDDTQMQPGQAFTKTWRLQNVGTCTWTAAYTIALFSGEAMGAPASVALTKNVAPGETIDVSVDMVAPQSAGTYQSNWKLRNASNAWFGIGPGGGSPFWVRIVVSQSATGTITPGTPTSTASATPNIQTQGAKTIIPTDKINLDTGQINSGGEDLSYESDAEGVLLLVPVNGAIFSLHGSSEPSLAACQSAPLSGAALVLQDMSRGTYLCYRTDLGLFGWLLLNTLRETDLALTFRFLTWALP